MAPPRPPTVEAAEHAVRMCVQAAVARWDFIGKSNVAHLLL